MQIVIEIPNKDIPKRQEVVDIRLHFIDGHIVSADGYGFAELSKGHGRLIDADSIYQIVRPIEQMDTEWGMTAETAIRLIHEAFNRAPTIIEADTESEDKE